MYVWGWSGPRIFSQIAQGPLEEGLRLLMAPLVLIQQRQVIEAGSGVGMVGAEGLFVNSQGLLVEGLASA